MLMFQASLLLNRIWQFLNRSCLCSPPLHKAKLQSLWRMVPKHWLLFPRECSCLWLLTFCFLLSLLDSRSFQMLHLWIQHHSELSKLLNIYKKNRHLASHFAWCISKFHKLCGTTDSQRGKGSCPPCEPQVQILRAIFAGQLHQEKEYLWYQCRLMSSFLQSWMHHLVSFCCFKWNRCYFN